jgi:hypothetical protein
MTRFLPSGYSTIGWAVILGVKLWKPVEAAEEEKRGGPRSMGIVENADGSEVELLEPTVADSMLYELHQHLFTGALPSYALVDDGRILPILPQHWGSRHAKLELEGIPICTLLTDQGVIQGTPLIKFEELKNLFAAQPASTAAQPPDANSRALNSAADDPARKSQGLRSRKPRTQNKRGRAEDILRELYGDRIPPQKEVSNKELERAVTQKLRTGEQLSPDSILRAAGRRK